MSSDVKTKMDQVRVGIIGAGSMARQHLAVMAQVKGMKAVGIASRTLTKAQAVAQEFGIGCCLDHIDDLIQEARPDALMVLVNEDQIFDVVRSMIPYGLPLFVEKPAGLTPKENLILAQLARQKGIKSMVGFNRRYYSIFHKGLAIIAQHGPLLGIHVQGHERFWRVREGGNFKPEIINHWIYANSTHTIDLLRFFGKEVSDVTVMNHAFKESQADQIAAMMRTTSGAIAQYQSHWYSPGGWVVVLYGDGVSVEFKPLEQGRWIDRDFKTHDILPEDYDARFKPGLYGQMQAFAAMVRTGQLPWPGLDLEGSYQTMSLAEQMCT